MRKAGHIGVTAPSRHLFPAGSPDPSLAHWVEHPEMRGTCGQGFVPVRPFIYPNKFEIWRLNSLLARGLAGGGVRLRFPASVCHFDYSHLFQNFADVAHQFVSSVCVSVQNIDRDDFRYAQKDFAFGAKYE